MQWSLLSSTSDPIPSGKTVHTEDRSQFPDLVVPDEGSGRSTGSLVGEYDFTIEHRAGPKHVNADAMSRLPCTQCGRSSHDEDADSWSLLWQG